METSARRKKARSPRKWFAVCWLASTFVPASAAADCAVSAVGVVFGAYDVFVSAPTDSAGTVTVQCSAGQAYVISISPGISGTFPSRQMTGGGNSLQYNLYVDSTRLSVWGDGSSGSATVAGTGSGAPVHHTVYGRIPARQNARLGSYSDQLTVTVGF